MPAAKFKIQRVCEVCGEHFFAKTLDSRYCSTRCSKIAWKRRKIEESKQQRLYEIAQKIPEAKTYITVPEAHALFGISCDTIHRLISKGLVGHINLGMRQTRVKKEDLLKRYPIRESPLQVKKKSLPKRYSMEPEDCYTISEICKKYCLDEYTVHHHIRKYSIPTRQIGNFVYVPKSEIDEIYKDLKL